MSKFEAWENFDRWVAMLLERYVINLKAEDLAVWGADPLDPDFLNEFALRTSAYCVFDLISIDNAEHLMNDMWWIVMENLPPAGFNFPKSFADVFDVLDAAHVFHLLDAGPANDSSSTAGSRIKGELIKLLLSSQSELKLLPLS